MRLLVFLRLVDADTHNLSAPTVGMLLLLVWICLQRRVEEPEVVLFMALAFAFAGKAYFFEQRARRKQSALNQIMFEVGSLRSKLEEVDASARRSGNFVEAHGKLLSEFHTELAETKAKVSQVSMSVGLRPK